MGLRGWSNDFPQEISDGKLRPYWILKMLIPPYWMKVTNGGRNYWLSTNDGDNDRQPEKAIWPPDLAAIIATYDCRSLSLSFGGHFLWTRNGREPQVCRWNFDAVSHSSRDTRVFPVWAAILLLPVVSRYSLSKSFTHHEHCLCIRHSQ